MITTTKKYHYKALDGTAKTHEAVTHHFTTGSDEISNEVCLVNTCGDYTGFEGIPDAVMKWLDKIGIDFTHFPNLSRLWGETRSEYAFTLRYELGHERDSVGHRDYSVILPYDEQLRLLLEAAEKIAQAIPYAAVRLVEMGAFSKQHELEVVFLFPCEPEKVIAGCNILDSKFDYVWDIGREPRAADNVTPDANEDIAKKNEEADTKQASFELNVSFYIEITQEDIDDIMCAALEGGICYWCRHAEVVGNYLAEYAHEQISRGGILRLHDSENDDVYELDRDKFLQGLRMFIERGNGDLVNIKNSRIDPADFDSECADTVVQYALFAQVIYS